MWRMDAAVVTGAAGALGGAVVDELLARGTAVVAMDRSSGRLTALGAREGVHVVAVDLAQRAAVQAAFAEVDALAVTPTALVAVAGAFAPGDLSTVDEDGFEAMWRTNVASALWSAQGAAPLLAHSGGGAIVTVGSKVTVTGTGSVAYTISKAAVVRLTTLLADELRPQGIRVNAVQPSTIDTPANRTWMPPELAAKAVAPAAIAKVIAFLSSADSAPISGAIVPVYGDA
jgi:NAD(P)-dependent dehydrogenase (short-subunit alcohol dehydrogenase family)